MITQAAKRRKYRVSFSPEAAGKKYVFIGYSEIEAAQKFLRCTYSSEETVNHDGRFLRVFRRGSVSVFVEPLSRGF